MNSELRLAETIRRNMTVDRIENPKRTRQYRRMLETSAGATLAMLGLFAAAPASAAGEPIAIPLAFKYAVDEKGVETDQISRLTIQLGVNGGAKRTYMFDTGSSALVGQVMAADPNAPREVSTYGDGSYGNLVQWVTPNSLDYGLANGGSGSFGGQPEAKNSLTRVVLEGGATYNKMKADCAAKPADCDLDGAPIFHDTVTQDNQQVERAWWAVKSSRLAVEAGTPAEDDGTFGTFGAGNFLDKEDRYTALGASTTSGFVISANANQTKGATPTPGCMPCVTLNLNASLRAQFDTLIAWNVAHDPETEFATFPGSGANASTQYEGDYTYEFTFKETGTGIVKKASISGPALLDTGTSEEIFLTQSGALAKLKAQGLDIAENTNVTILSVTINGGGDPVTISNPVLSRQSGESAGDVLIATEI